MGLLDMFGPAPGGGLLDPSAYDPRMDIALGIAGQLLDNAGPSNTPRGMFQGVPQALMQGRQGAFQRQVQQQQYADMLASSAERKRQQEARTRFGAMMAPTYTREAPTDQWQQQAPNVDQDGLLAAFGDAYPDAAAKGLGGLLYPEEKVVPAGAGIFRGNQRVGGMPAKLDDPPSGYQWSGGRLAPIPGGPADTQGPFKGTGMDAQALGVVYAYESKKGRGEPTTPDEDYGYNLAQWQLMQPRVTQGPDGKLYTVNPPSLPTRAPANPPPGAVPAPAQSTGPTVTPVPGAPEKPPSLTDAATAAKVTTSQRILPQITSAIISPDGNVDRMLIAKMQANVGEGRTLNAQLEEVIANLLYLKSGATAGEAEIAATANQYAPKAWDSPATVKDKLQRLQNYFDSVIAPKSGAPQTPAIDADLMRQIEQRWK